jgi:hypothetical protein
MSAVFAIEYSFKLTPNNRDEPVKNNRAAKIRPGPFTAKEKIYVADCTAPVRRQRRRSVQGLYYIGHLSKMISNLFFVFSLK